MTGDAVLAAAVTGVLGVIAAITAATITARAKGSRARENTSKLDSGTFRLRIAEPSPYAEVYTQGFPVRGLFEYMPAEYEIWLAVCDVQRSTYWPQPPAASCVRSPVRNEWVARINHVGGEHDKHRKEIAALVVGPDGQALFRHYVETGTATGSWHPITELTSDTYDCDSRTVIFRSA